MVAKTSHSNPGWLARLLKVFEKAKASELAVGYPAGKSAGIKYPDGTQVAFVAAVNNYGSTSRGIPARPFMTEGAVDAVKVTRPIIEALVPAMNRGKITAEGILEEMGPHAVGAIQDKIKDGAWEPNAQATVALKGSAKPLMGTTGLLRSSITYVVRKG